MILPRTLDKPTSCRHDENDVKKKSLLLSTGKEVHAEEQAEETKEANGQEEESYEGKTTGLKSDDALQCRMHARSFLALFLISHFCVFPNSII